MQAVYIKQYENWRTTKQTFEDASLTKKAKFEFKTLASDLILDKQENIILSPKTKTKWKHKGS